MTKKILILGAGAFGFALAKYLSDKALDEEEIHKGSSYDSVNEFYLYDVNKELINHIKTKKTHKYFFKGIKLNNLVKPVSDVKSVLLESDMIILAIPAQVIRSFLKEHSYSMKDNVVLLNSSKGIEANTSKLISEIVEEEMKNKSFEYAVLSGGMVAIEFISGDGIFGADIASDNREIGLDLQKYLSSKKLKIYLNDDVRGVEIAGAMKNVISISSGFMDGLGFPFGSKTLIVSLASHEIRCISEILNSKSHTYDFQTQAFGNDYIMSTLGNTRNRYFGELIGKGYSPKSALDRLKNENKTCEGYYTTKVAYDIAKKNKLKTPIINMIYEVLYKNEDIRKSITRLMSSKLENTLNCRYDSL